MGAGFENPAEEMRASGKQALGGVKTAPFSHGFKRGVAQGLLRTRRECAKRVENARLAWGLKRTRFSQRTCFPRLQQGRNLARKTRLILWADFLGSFSGPIFLPI